VYLKIWEQGFEFIEESLTETSLGVEDATAIMDNVADDMMTDIYQLFQSQGRRGGGSWAPLSEKYQIAKLEAGYDVRILFRKHDLVRAATVRGAPDQTLEVDESSVYLTVDLDYAEYHMTGTGRMPARPWIKFTESDKRHWAQMIADQMIAPMKRRRYSTFSIFETPL